MIDILKPKKSKVVSDLSVGTMLVYGNNRTGKTSCLAKAPKPLFLSFEFGLEATNDVPYFPITKWTTFQEIVKSLTNPFNEKEIHEAYQTIVIDTADAMCRLASEYICATYGITSIGEDSQGKRGWGRWTEYRNEIQKQISLLANAGFFVAFIAHEKTKEFPLDDGNTYKKMVPAGDDKSMDFICDLCGIIGYACASKRSEEDKTRGLSTLYLKDSLAYKAGTRYDFMPEAIPEWNFDKLKKALSEAVAKQVERDNASVVSSTDFLAQRKEEERVEIATRLPIEEIVDKIGAIVEEMSDRDGNIDKYLSIMEEELGTKEFKASEATEKQREQVEKLLRALEKAEV